MSFKTRLIAFLLPVGLCLAGTAAFGQADRTEFDESMRQWKATYVELLETWGEFKACEEWESEDIKERFLQLVKQGDEQELRAIELAAELYRLSDQNVPELQRMLTGLPVRLFERYRYAMAARVGNALLSHDPNNMATMFDTIKSAFFSNQYELAGRLLDTWEQQLGPLPPELEPFVAILPGYRDAWKEEEQRQVAAESGQPNPRLKFKTEIGNFVVELYEDDYPVIVNNLINLIEERKLYQGFQFFEVLEHQIVRAGCPRNDGTLLVPVCPVTMDTVNNSRKHFGETFSLVINPANRTASAQFTISRIPMPELDTRNLVIGRVVEGMPIVNQITATRKLDDNLLPVPIEDAVPVAIESMEVLQKRDHEYKFINPEPENQ